LRPAVARVAAMGLIDPARVGLIGHSWGGYTATFVPTRTNIFAASVAGAPLTDFVSFMGQIHWRSGMAELEHWETGQARMEVPFWEDPQAHERNSPIHRVQDLETPLLMAFGDNDGTVDWDQGTEFYNFARRAGKQMVLLVYEGEDHGFRRPANQVDYHRRILEWFGHYLKGEPAPAWITHGVPVARIDEEKRRVARPDAKRAVP
jgi:dipeptidyl aminopeptidase/acylaminoacyl peptidase